MKYRRLALVTALAASLTAQVALAGSHEEERSSAAEAGREEFTTYCTSCHGLSGVGDGPAASSLKKPPADLTKIAERRDGEFPDEEIAAFIDGRTKVDAHGSREMPVWGEHLDDEVGIPENAAHITKARISLLVEYLKSIQVK